MNNIQVYLRKLAKRTEILNQFVASKEINGIKFFVNEIDFSRLQNSFISYLYFYYNLWQDIYANEVSEIVLTNEIYEDAWIYYKSKKNKDKSDKSTGKQRKLQATFSKTNEIKFPQKGVN